MQERKISPGWLQPHLHELDHIIITPWGDGYQSIGICLKSLRSLSSGQGGWDHLRIEKRGSFFEALVPENGQYTQFMVILMGNVHPKRP